MLDQVAVIELSPQLWRAVPSRAALPCSEDEFFAERGIVGSLGESRRQYVRIHMREMGVLVRGEERHAVYTKDASPKGVALISPVQIFPRERMTILLGRQSKMELELRRCRRIGERCYECGTVFADGVIPPGMYTRLIRTHGMRQ